MADSFRGDDVEVHDVVKRFGGVKALEKVSMRFAAGKITAVIGPNGSGKSTLLAIVAGDLRADSGWVRLGDGAMLSRSSRCEIARLGLARTYQVPRLAARLTVMENLMFAASSERGERLIDLCSAPRRIWRHERARARDASRVAASFRLTEVGSEYAGNLSGGQRKLLTLAMATIVGPRVALLDEPVAGVNVSLFDTVIQALRSARDAGRTVVVIEHNMEFVRAVADTAYVLSSGRVIAHGTPAQVQHESAVRAAYVGEEPRGA